MNYGVGSTSSGSFNGWTCSNCGMYVPWGSTHSCQPSQSPVVQFDPTFMYLDLGGKLLAVLERIASALEKEQA